MTIRTLYLFATIFVLTFTNPVKAQDAGEKPPAVVESVPEAPAPKAKPADDAKAADDAKPADDAKTETAADDEAKESESSTDKEDPNAMQKLRSLGYM